MTLDPKDTYIEPDSEMFTCDDCERPIVPKKLKGIGYVCDSCLDARLKEELYGW